MYDTKSIVVFLRLLDELTNQYLFQSDCRVVASLQVNHLRCLHEFVEAQAAYYKRCHHHMQELQKELGR